MDGVQRQLESFEQKYVMLYKRLLAVEKCTPCGNQNGKYILFRLYTTIFCFSYNDVIN